MNPLDDLIRQEIRARGPMRFDRFMELALYHPEHGYYASPRPIGRGGDFFTSVSVGPLFGKLLAHQARQMAQLLDEPEFWIVEQGAHDGRLARDILESCKEWDEFFAKMRFLIVEPSPALREAQQHLRKDFPGRIEWIDRLENWKGARPAGLVLSNELADALPVRAIEAKDGQWRERRVAEGENGSLTWTLENIDEELRDAIAGLPLAAVDGYQTEIGLAARRWMSGTAGFLRRGYVVTIDYGYEGSKYYAPYRRTGTLTCYRGHRRDDNVLEMPGEQDITAHVDFTALEQAGEAAGLRTLGLVDQQRFLVGVLEDSMKSTKTPLTSGEIQAFRTLTHPEHLGERFKVLVQGRDAPENLCGLRFARGIGLE